MGGTYWLKAAFLAQIRKRVARQQRVVEREWALRNRRLLSGTWKRKRQTHRDPFREDAGARHTTFFNVHARAPAYTHVSIAVRASFRPHKYEEGRKVRVKVNGVFRCAWSLSICYPCKM